MISIRWHLTILLCAAIGALFVATGLGVFLAMRGLLLSRFDETLTAKARALITASEIDDGEFEIDLTVQDFAGFGHGGDDYFEIRRLSGELFLRSPSLTDGRAGIADLGSAGVRPDNQARIVAVQPAEGRPARFYVQRFYPKDDSERRFQDLYLIVASPTRSVQVQTALLATVLAVAGCVALLLLVPVVRFALSRGLQPLVRLADDLGRLKPENLNQRLPSNTLPAELTPVAERLNEWVGRLESSFERERRFSSHAAHELRTPLAEIKGMAELGAMWPEEATQERCAEIVTVAEGLEDLLSKLFLLARADAGRLQIHNEAIDLPISIENALGRIDARIRQRGLCIDKRVEARPFTSDGVMWEAILQNLLSNAVAHAPPGSTIRVEASPERLLVQNPAPDLKTEDLDYIFERFWRKDHARSGHEHSGLGMSVVLACASLLHGNCRASLTPEGNYRVTVVWDGVAAGSDRL